MKNTIIVSGCLLGINCRYDGKSKPCKKLLELQKTNRLIPVCPEQLGGLSTPRIPAEVQGGDGKEIIKGKSKVTNKNSTDVTVNFLNGAKETLKIAKLMGAKEFIGKSKSPSCGTGVIYDGTFSDTLVLGDGVTSALLKKRGIKVSTEKDL